MALFHAVAHTTVRRQLEQHAQRLAISGARRGARQSERMLELERDLARVALLARALADACLRKGLLTAEELERQLAETDFADGVFDGELDPKLIAPGASRLAELQPIAEAPAARRSKPVVRKRKRGSR